MSMADNGYWMIYFKLDTLSCESQLFTICDCCEMECEEFEQS